MTKRQCPVRDPQKKGRVESNVKYIKNAFVPLRDFRGLSDANTQLRDWLNSVQVTEIMALPVVSHCSDFMTLGSHC